MQAFTSYSINISFITALVSLSCTLIAQGQHFNNIKHRSTTTKGKGSPYSEILLLKNVYHKLRDFKESSDNTRRPEIKLNDFEFLQYIPWRMHDKNIPTGKFTGDRDAHNIILSEGIRNSPSSDNNFDDLIQSHNSIILDILLSRRKNVSKTNVLQQLEGIRNYLKNRFHFRNLKRKTSTSSGPSFATSNNENSIKFTRLLGLDSLSKHSLPTKSSPEPRKVDTHNTIDNSQLSRYSNEINNKASDDRGNDIDHSSSQDRDDEDSDTSTKQYVVIDYDSNHIHKADDIDDNDGNSISATSRGNETDYKSSTHILTPGKRGSRREGNSWYYWPGANVGRTVGGRNHRKIYIRKLNDEIVHGQHIRRLVKNNAKAEYKACKPNEDGSEPMRCPTAQNICLYDDQLCNKYKDCPDGSDEIFSVCVTKHLVQKFSHKNSKTE